MSCLKAQAILLSPVGAGSVAAYTIQKMPLQPKEQPLLRSKVIVFM